MVREKPSLLVIYPSMRGRIENDRKLFRLRIRKSKLRFNPKFMS